MQPTSSPVKVGVIGIGNMGWHHARVLSLLKDANLIGVADPNEERGKLAIEQFQCKWFKNYKDLIPKVDAICIAVPTLLHQKVGLDCLNGGTNVLIEKPIAANELEAKSLIAAANASNCLLQVGHIERFNPAFRELNKIVNKVDEAVEQPKFKTVFESGETVRINDGPFNDFNGVVEEVDYEKNLIKVSVSIFGKSTPVELNFSQVEKV